MIYGWKYNFVGIPNVPKYSKNKILYNSSRHKTFLESNFEDTISLKPQSR